MQPTNALKNLRYFLGLVHCISKFIKNFAKFWHPTIEKICYFIWTKNYVKHFNEMKEKIPSLGVRIKFEESSSGLGVAPGLGA